MCRSPVLIQPDVNKQFTLHVDASAYSMGAVTGIYSDVLDSESNCDRSGDLADRRRFLLLVSTAQCLIDST